MSDQFYEVFTVRETMLFAAALILPKSSKDERRFKVERLIRECGMGSCAVTKIGGEVFRGISTGEIKVFLLFPASFLTLYAFVYCGFD